MNSVCTILYYPLEHAAWAADHQLLPLNSSHLWTGAIALWALPLLIACVQILGQLMHQIKTDANQQLNHLVLDLVENLCNLSLAIFWMPKGFLWGGKLSSLWWGFFGTVSSLISLYKTIKSQQMPNVCTHEEAVSTH